MSQSIDREQLIANAVAAFHDLLLQGKIIDPDTYCRDYPELGPELREQILALDEIDTVLTPSETPHGATAPKLPDRLSGYKILGLIGAGGMGRVLLAFDEKLGRKVAVKTLSPRYAGDPKLRERFMREARALARLNHPNIVSIYNLGDAGEEPHFVMEHIEGASLTEAARRLTLNQKIDLMFKVVMAVDFLHKRRMIHRDLKPGNVLVGSDLEPKVLDFGLAAHFDDPGDRLTQAGEIMGTPNYFSPEQARSAAALDARSDIFSLGTILYELITGSAPFRGESAIDQIRSICECDPEPPRRINSAVPGELQNICLKALEKDPAQRYQSAREMADDLARLLAGEPVLALPSSYARMIAGKVEQHVRELGGWRQDRLLSEQEFDSLRKLYDRLIDREDAWIMEVRRLSLSQVSLYLGGWLLVTGAALMALFRYFGLSGAAAVGVVSVGAASACYVGVRVWRRGRQRIGIAFLLAFCLLTPTLLVIAMNEWGVFSALTKGREDLELYHLLPVFKRTTNAQLWWAVLLSLPAYLWLRRFTRSSVFSLVIAVMAALFGLVTLLRMGLIEWLTVDSGKVYFYLIPIAIFFFTAGFIIERTGHSSDSRYFYPIAVGFTLIALSGVAAFHQPYAELLEAVAPVTRAQVEYLFIINALIYLALQYACERVSSPQTRWVARAFRFFIPGHVMMSLLLLGLAASGLWERSPTDNSLRLEARLFEVLLPAVACLFVFGSVVKQMKNFFVTGLLFLGIGVVRLQQDLFKDRAAWPLSLIVIGFLLMFAAANLDRIKRAARRNRRLLARTEKNPRAGEIPG
ncbi:MAG TPA: protein kinase [Blastocatellia bacterium]|jgi:serine/threonine protein kinase|nr:protein kinase [Blastocatellia bacterium]